MSGSFTPPPSADVATLQTWLADAQAAYHQLMTGAKPSVVMYAQGDGTRSVTYTRTNVGQLAAYIASLQMQLGYRPRRAIGLRF